MIRPAIRGLPRRSALRGGLDAWCACDKSPSVYPNARAGKLRGLAVTTKQRVPTAPEIPTLNAALDPTYVGIPPALKGSLTETRVTLDTTVTPGDTTIIERGFLTALRDAAVVKMASRYGDPVDLLEGSI